MSVEDDVVIDTDLLHAAEAEHLIGEAGKARVRVNSAPQVGFEELIRVMVNADAALLNGERAGLRVSLP